MKEVWVELCISLWKRRQKNGIKVAHGVVDTAVVSRFNWYSKDVINNISKKGTSQTTYLFKHFIQQLLFEHLKYMKYLIMLFIGEVDEDTLLISTQPVWRETRKEKHSNIVWQNL